MQEGKLLFTFKKVLLEDLGVYAIQVAKTFSHYKGETPKTITFEADETTERDKVFRDIRNNIQFQTSVLRGKVLSQANQNGLIRA